MNRWMKTVRSSSSARNEPVGERIMHTASEFVSGTMIAKAPNLSRRTHLVVAMNDAHSCPRSTVNARLVIL